MVPNGLVPVTPNYGMYGQTAMNPYGMGFGSPAPGYTPQGTWGSPYGNAYGSAYGMSPYGASPYGYGTLPATAGQVQQPVSTPAVAPASAPVRRPAATKKGAAPVRSKAKTFTDKAGNVRQVGTGKIVKPTTRVTTAGVGTVPTGTPAPVGYGAPAADLGQLTSPASYLPAMAGTLPFAGGSPFAAGAQATAGLTAGYPAATGMQPTAIPSRPVA